jgi:hypothetical protein
VQKRSPEDQRRQRKIVENRPHYVGRAVPWTDWKSRLTECRELGTGACPYGAASKQCGRLAASEACNDEIVRWRVGNSWASETLCAIVDQCSVETLGGITDGRQITFSSE